MGSTRHTSGKEFTHLQAPVRAAQAVPQEVPESAMLKLALNGVYGDSNNVFSVFYDPLFTMTDHAQRATAAVPAG
jgi:hypothetical protein